MEIVTVRWFRFDENSPKKCMGFAFRQDGRELFFHWGTRHNFTSHGDEPDFDYFSFPEAKPQTGHKLRCEVGMGPKGLMITGWGYESDYQLALEAIENQKFRDDNLLADLEGVRLRANALFRVIEQEHRFGKPTQKQPLIRFTGTRQEFVNALKPIIGQPVLYQTGKNIDGYQYVRWFERETENGWVRCCDPREVVLDRLAKLSIDTAAALLRNASVVRGSDQISWFNREVRTTYTWRDGNKSVASGWDNKVEQRVIFPATQSYLETSFEGCNAYVLQKLGRGSKAINSEKADQSPTPLPTRMQQLRRLTNKDAHDLAELGRSHSEWEELSRRLDPKGQQ